MSQTELRHVQLIPAILLLQFIHAYKSGNQESFFISILLNDWTFGGGTAARWGW
jgi:hypothetical protein